MKFLFCVLFVATSAWGQEERVIRQISKHTVNIPFKIEKDTFIPNVQGYACPWPGIRYPYIFQYHAQLRHGSGWMDSEALAIKADELNHQFCSFQPAHKIFGTNFVVGNEIKLPVTVERAIVELDGKLHLREIVSSKLGIRNLESKAYAYIDEEN